MNNLGKCAAKGYLPANLFVELTNHRFSLDALLKFIQLIPCMDERSVNHAGKLILSKKLNLNLRVNVAAPSAPANLFKTKRKEITDKDHETAATTNKFYAVDPSERFDSAMYDFGIDDRRTRTPIEDVLLMCIVCFPRFPTLINEAIEKLDVRLQDFLCFLTR